jgi:spore coat polysaccharide biosynthesis protein SpsF (cytidylyltransferase family)
MGSTRLPNKVMMPVLGKPLLGWMIERIAACAEVDEIVIATTTDARDDVIAQYVQSLGRSVYRGSEEDVLDRYYNAACLVDADTVVRITADCPLLDPKVVDELIRQFVIRDVDFLSNSEPLPSSWPDGMDVSIFSFSALRLAWEKAVKPSEREHVTFYFWNNLAQFACERVEHNPDWSKYRITIDYPEDFALLNTIIEYFGADDSRAITTLSMEDIVSFLETNPSTFNLNKEFQRGLGWTPALARDKTLGH